MTVVGERITPPGDDVTSGVDEVMAVAARHATAADRDAAFPVDALDALRASGLLGLLVPTAHGGRGGDAGDLVDVTMQLARVDMAVGLIFAMHCQQVAAVVRYADDELRARLLPAIARGEIYLASVTTELGKGGHLLSSRSPAPADDGMLHLDRHAPIVTGGSYADGFLVTVLAPDATSPNQVSLVYAAREQLDVQVLGGWDPLGMRATHSLPMRLVGRVPQRQVVGEPGNFRAIAVGVFGPLAHLGWSAAWLGTATGVLSRIVTHIRSPEGRKRFDTSSELLLTRLARIRSRLDMVHAMLRHTTDVVATAPDLSRTSVQLLVNGLKVNAAEQCYAALNEAVELVGLRHGYLRDSALHVERALRDLRSASLTYSNDRLYLVNGSLALLDPEVHFA